MQVFIMRHGDAALDAASDSVRPLTPCGCDESRLMANWLKGQKVDIERVLVSPFLRAEQTLDVVGDCMNLPAQVDVLPELTPCGDVGLVSAYLRALANEEIGSVLVISHLPLVGYPYLSFVRAKRRRCSRRPQLPTLRLMKAARGHSTGK